MVADSTAESSSTTQPTSKGGPTTGGFGRIPGMQVSGTGKGLLGVPSLMDLGFGRGIGGSAVGRGGGCAIPPPKYSEEDSNVWKDSGDLGGANRGERSAGDSFTSGSGGIGIGRGSFDSSRRGGISNEGPARDGGRGVYNAGRGSSAERSEFSGPGSRDSLLGDSFMTGSGAPSHMATNEAKGRELSNDGSSQGGVKSLVNIGKGVSGSASRGSLSGSNRGSRVNIMSGCTGGRLAPPPLASSIKPLISEKTSGFGGMGRPWPDRTSGAAQSLGSSSSSFNPDVGFSGFDHASKNAEFSGSSGPRGGFSGSSNSRAGSSLSTGDGTKVKSLFGRTAEFLSRKVAPGNSAPISDSGAYGSKYASSLRGGQSGRIDSSYISTGFSTGSQGHGGMGGARGFGTTKFGAGTGGFATGKIDAYSTDISHSAGVQNSTGGQYSTGGGYGYVESMDYSTGDSYTYGAEQAPTGSSYLTGVGEYDTMTGSKPAYKDSLSYETTGPTQYHPQSTSHDQDFRYPMAAAKSYVGTSGNSTAAAFGSVRGGAVSTTSQFGRLQANTGEFGQQGHSLAAQTTSVGWEGSYSDYANEGAPEVVGTVNQSAENWNTVGVGYGSANVGSGEWGGAQAASFSGQEGFGGQGVQAARDSYAVTPSASYDTSAAYGMNQTTASSNPFPSTYGNQGASVYGGSQSVYVDPNSYGYKDQTTGYANQTVGYDNTAISSYSTTTAVPSWTASAAALAPSLSGYKQLGLDAYKSNTGFADANVGLTSYTSAPAYPVTGAAQYGSTAVYPSAGAGVVQYGSTASLNPTGYAPASAPGYTATANPSEQSYEYSYY